MSSTDDTCASFLLWITTLTRSRAGLLALAMLSTLGAFGASAPSRAHASWPFFVLVRGGGLATPIVLSRPHDLGMRGDVIRLYNSLDDRPPLPAGFAVRRHYDVAEYWDTRLQPLTYGQPPRDLRYEQGSTFAKIYAGTPTLPPVWVGRYDGREDVPRVIGDSGIAILTHAGLRLR